MASPTVLQARVKSVMSGDTVILAHPNDSRKERTLSLAFVTSPRLRRDDDEPYAFSSRDYLRKILVGKIVNFKVLYVIPTSKREYGILWLANGPQIPEAAVADGWLKVRDDAGKRDEESSEITTLVEKLQASEAHAKADSKGLWAGDGSGVIKCSYELSDPKEFAEENKGKSFDGIIERVLSGDRVIARLILSPKEHLQVMVLIAGIRAPSTKRTNPSDGQEQAAEPFGEESQQFLESRMLQRQAQIVILGLSPQNQIVATVKHPQQGTIAPHILKAGLAKCTDFHTTLLGQEMGTLREAEREAKANRVGVYRGHVAAKAGKESEAVVSKILSADTIFLRSSKTGDERRINLSSVRQPKPSDPKQGPWQAEAKEFLRKKLIGKHVKFNIDGKRAATEGYEEREMGTVTLAGKNVAALLIENGFGSVIRHRADDTDRSPIYDELLLAEQTAQAEKKGIWSEKAPATKGYVDYSESLEKAKRMATTLSRQKKVPAVVDYVKSASRFTVLVPRDNAKLTFVLSGIRAPRSARNPTDQGEPFGREAHDFATKRLTQRDVEIDVEDTDKVGGFIGALYVNRENFAKALLEEGFASVHAYSAEKSGSANELFAAEKKAKDARKGIWHDYDPSQENEEEAPAQEYKNGTSNGDAAAAPRKQDYRDVVVTHVDESGRLKLQQIGKGTAALQDLMTSFNKFHLSSKPLDSAPKAGDIVSAQFYGDWYRGKVNRNDRENKKAEILYLDYGNSEMVKWSELRPLPSDKFGTSVVKPQAVLASLSFVQLPSGQYLQDTIDYLKNEVQDRPLVASVDFVDSKDGSLSVTLFDAKRLGESMEDSVNADLVLEGLAMVPRKLKAWERGADSLAMLRKKEATAKDEHRGMWEYGDVTADED